MDGRPVQLRIAGQSYRVVSSANEEELQRLAATVSAKVAELSPRNKAAPQAVLLAAISLAHELEEERSRRQTIERRSREMFQRVLARIDEAIAPSRDQH